MLHKFAKIIARFFVQQNVIDSNKEVIYAYGMELLLSDVLNLLISLTIVVLTHKVFPSLFFLGTFLFIRRFSGGFHAKTHLGCMLTLSIVMIIFSFGICNMPDNFILISNIIAVLLSTLLIFLFAPVSHPNKPLHNDRLAELKLKSRSVSVFFALIVLAMFLFKFQKISLYVSSGMLLSAMMVFFGYISTWIEATSAKK